MLLNGFGIHGLLAIAGRRGRMRRAEVSWTGGRVRIDRRVCTAVLVRGDFRLTHSVLSARCAACSRVPRRRNTDHEGAIIINSSKGVAWAPVIVFTVAACALAWLVALPLWFGDGLAEPVSGVILPLMMLTPAVATLLVTFVMRVPARGERARFLGLWPLRPAKRVVWLMIAAWLAPPLLIFASILVSAALGFVQLDFTFAAFGAEIAKALPADAPMPPVEVIVFAQIAMIPVGALVNSIAAFGEEIGWRGWLLPALRPLGTWPALLISGAVWGFWHSPVILLGYNFGRTDVTGVLLMMGGCVAWGILLGWLRLRSASVWPAVIAHGSLNAAGGLIVIFAAAKPDLALAGPLGVGGWIVIAVVTLVLVLTGQFRKQPELAESPRRRHALPRS